MEFHRWALDRHSSSARAQQYRKDRGTALYAAVVLHPGSTRSLSSGKVKSISSPQGVISAGPNGLLLAD